ncbi:pyruvate dehydrogenase (acetyl-transferring), homodimeric type [Salsipaludibacter albus]|uniref:pyruvate dehydrogenase (acetyl-transferring), homodimeric type n=1 Tax=Salsipaludibacter albus TaxID=2849650 RepID=UPI003B75BCE4
MREQQVFADDPIITDGIPAQYPDIDEQETVEWLESFDVVTDERGKARSRYLLLRLLERARQRNIGVPSLTTTDYINTIPPEREPTFPGDEHLERRIRAYIRWNAAVMVHRANIVHGVGGHIGSYASAASLYEVGFNHFFRGKDHPGGGDQVYIQGHASPGVYARAFLEGRLTTEQLDAFRREVRPGGLASYPHPRLMPEFWEFPTVSMGFAAINAIYQARFNRYLHNRGIRDTSDQHVWAFLGDGETAEPETLGALSVATREGLDNLTFVINCNLQQLDGPVRGNGKIMQELEGVFRGAGWNVLKVVWGSEWDELLAKDVDGLLINRMNEVPDGQFQTYTVKPGDFIREDFFGADPRLLKMVEHLSDEQIEKLPRGGHDYRKVYAAFKAATEFHGAPTVILAQTIKGWTLGPDFEARNAVHQMKKLNEEALKTFRDRLYLDISDEEIEADLPPYITFDDDADEQVYLQERREKLGGYLPERRPTFTMPELPEPDLYGELKKGSGNQEVATTMALVRLFKDLFRHKGSDKNGIGKRIVPIIPDEARTFGMDSMFPTLKLYSPTEQRYESVDSNLLLSYQQSPKGQILHEGITEAGAMASFHAVGSSYATHGEPMIPLYMFYSMFGFQRTGDQIWSAADQRARGFLIGATAGGTTLNGEGLQHQDRHSLLLAQSNPAVEAYDPSFAYELAVLVQNGIERMFSDDHVEGGEDVIFYLTVYNEPRLQPPMPDDLDPDDVVRGIYRYREGESGQHEAHIFSSGTIMYEALRAQELLAEDFDVRADVWSAPGWNRLLRDGTECEAWNRMNPDEEQLVPELTTVLEGTEGPYIAVSDWLKATPVQIADWIPGRFAVLGTDGFGRSDTREMLRRFHRIDAESIAVTVLAELAAEGDVEWSTVSDAITKYGLDELRHWPFIGNRRTGDVTF